MHVKETAILIVLKYHRSRLIHGEQEVEVSAGVWAGWTACTHLMVQLSWCQQIPDQQRRTPDFEGRGRCCKALLRFFGLLSLLFGLKSMICSVILRVISQKKKRSWWNSLEHLFSWQRKSSITFTLFTFGFLAECRKDLNSGIYRSEHLYVKRPFRCAKEQSSLSLVGTAANVLIPN